MKPSIVSRFELKQSLNQKVVKKIFQQIVQIFFIKMILIEVKV